MLKRLSICLLILALAAPFLAAQEPYKLPPKNVLDILNAPPTPRVTMSPDREVMLLVESESMPTIAYVAQPMLRIAGMRITPANNSGQVLTFSTGLTLKAIKDGLERKIDLPAGIKLTGASWSDDGKWISFARYLDDGVELWVVDAITGKAKSPDPRAAQHGQRRYHLDARQQEPSLPDDPGGPRPGSPRAPRADRPHGADVGRQTDQSRHPAGPAQEPLRRSPLRLLRHGPACRDRHPDRPGQAHRQARHLRFRQPLPRWILPPGQPDQAALLLQRLDERVRPLDRGLGPGRQPGQDDRRPPARRGCAHERRPGRAPLGQLAGPEAGHPGLGRGPRRRRYRQRSPLPRPGRDPARPVHGRAQGSLQVREPLRRPDLVQHPGLGHRLRDEPPQDAPGLLDRRHRQSRRRPQEAVRPQHPGRL